MAKGKPEIDIMRELSPYLDGSSLERIGYYLIEPMDDLGVGEAARLGAAFTALGARLTEAAKSFVEGARLHTDREVLFRSIPPSYSTGVDVAAVKKIFPESERPDLYRKSYRKGYVSVELPFSIPKRSE